MKNDPIIKELLDFLANHGMEQQQFAEIIGKRPITLSRWINSVKPSTETVKNAIRFGMYTISNENNREKCHLEHCPAKPPVDYLTQYLLDEWGRMNGDEKAQVIATIETIKEKKSIPEDVDVTERGA